MEREALPERKVGSFLSQSASPGGVDTTELQPGESARTLRVSELPLSRALLRALPAEVLREIALLTGLADTAS